MYFFILNVIFKFKFMIEDEPQFKQNLFQTFKDTGMVDNMKA